MKNILSGIFSFIGWIAGKGKEHPYMTVSITGILGALAYYYGGDAIAYLF